MAQVTLVRKVRLLVAAAAAKPGPAIGQVSNLALLIFQHYLFLHGFLVFDYLYLK